MGDPGRAKPGEEDEVEIDRMVVELPEGGDPAFGEDIARHVLQELSRLLGEA